MSEEPQLPEEYDTLDFPDTYFEELEKADQVDSPLYHIWQGQVYDKIRFDLEEPETAGEIATYLNQRELDDARQTVDELLGDGQ